MPRAEFNTTADVFTGPGSTPPNQYRFTISCRLVPASPFLQYHPIAFSFSAYINYTGLLISTGDEADVYPNVSIDQSTCDYFELPPGSGIFYTAIMSRLVRPRIPGLAAYRRVWVKDGLP